MTDLRRSHDLASRGLIDEARATLSAFVLDKADDVRRREGFSWRPSESAPSTLEEVHAEHRASRASGLPYRVSSLYCTDIIFSSAASNHGMRFWHDMEHVRLGLDFSAEHEMHLAVHHLQELRCAGFRPDSLEFRLLHADSLGQVLCLATLGRFPSNQLRFALWCLTDGVDEAIAYEYTKAEEVA